ncbi:helix-turn-helix domain-containing protein [Tepidanaerobacter sp. GT38]|uniref:YerC/YecD family TrpR-related protein n=1 Tax=Tepidanaerobacter sp. GT38 TaxID=2722793 RepID=UPI001F406FA5|nr:helix-turn-helix domain-containing protein [Tepidanaerobacter sp. GT38]
MELQKLKDPYINMLFDAILLLQNREECYRFFEDICTIGEVQSMAQRLQVAKMLKEGKTYTEIAQVTGASTATISRVKRFLHYGADGYNIILERLAKTNQQED